MLFKSILDSYNYKIPLQEHQEEEEEEEEEEHQEQQNDSDINQNANQKENININQANLNDELNNKLKDLLPLKKVEIPFIDQKKAKFSWPKI